MIAGPERAGDFVFTLMPLSPTSANAAQAKPCWNIAMTDISLRADCAQCAAICCVALAFDRSELFAFDKAAGQPCPNLSPRGRCAIHARREEGGFAGCVAFDCLGVGQRVTQMFGGRSWRDGAETAREMFDAFSAMRGVHELLLLVREAGKLSLTPRLAEFRRELEGRLAQDAETPQSLADFARSGRKRDVLAFLAELRSVASLPELDPSGISSARRRAGRSCR